MQTQTVDFYIHTSNGVVQQIGRSVMVTPKVNFKEGNIQIKWYKDRIKNKNGIDGVENRPQAK